MCEVEESTSAHLLNTTPYQLTNHLAQNVQKFSLTPTVLGSAVTFMLQLLLLITGISMTD
jgi:hypothetical protein